MKPLLQAMKEGRLYFDGGMGSMLQAAGLPEGLLPDVWGLENPRRYRPSTGPIWRPAAA